VDEYPIKNLNENQLHQYRKNKFFRFRNFNHSILLIIKVLLRMLLLHCTIKVPRGTSEKGLKIFSPSLEDLKMGKSFACELSGWSETSVAIARAWPLNLNVMADDNGCFR